MQARFDGCFGVSALLQLRHEATYRARTAVSTLIISVGDLSRVFDEDPISVRRFCQLTTRAHLADVRTRRLIQRLSLVRGRAPRARTESAAMHIAIQWRRFTMRRAMLRDSLFAHVMAADGAADGSAGVDLASRVSTSFLPTPPPVASPRRPEAPREAGAGGQPSPTERDDPRISQMQISQMLTMLSTLTERVDALYELQAGGASAHASPTGAP